MIKLKVDSRDKEYYRRFGSVTEFEAEKDFDTPLIDAVQPPGDVHCTEYMTYGIATDETNLTFTTNDIFDHIPHDSNGADPRDSLSYAVKTGLLPDGKTDRIKKWSSYWTVHTSDIHDAFDAVRSAMTLVQSPIAIWTPWFSNWINNSVLPKGDRVGSYHAYNIEGWKIVNGETMLILEAWLGRKLYISREVFNDVMSYSGSNSAVLSTAEIDAIHNRNIFELIRDACLNVILLLQQLIKQKNMETQLVTTPSQKLYDTALALKGQYLTLDPTVPKIYNCAETISYILKQCGYDMPEKGYAGTIALDNWLKNHCEEIVEPGIGDIVISVTEGNIHGHVGIQGHEAILSNDSQTGTLESYWSLAGWKEFYGKQKKLLVKYYRVP